MSKKTEDNAFEIAVVVTLLIVLIVGLGMIIFSEENYSEYCLNKFGEKYCSEKNLDFENAGYSTRYGEIGFVCNLDYDVRNVRAKKDIFYLFTEEEKEECLK